MLIISLDVFKLQLNIRFKIDVHGVGFMDSFSPN